MKRQATSPVSGRTASPARVLFLLDDLGGGTGNHILSMIRLWNRDRWYPEILSWRPAGTRVQPEGVEIHVLPPFQWWEPFPLGHLRRFVLIWLHLRRRRYDLVHAYFFWSIFFGRLLRLLGAIEHLVENREDLGFGWGRFEYVCLRATRRIPDRVICVCDAVREVVVKKEKLDPEKTEVIRNGIDPGDPPRRETELRSEFGIPQNVPLVGMVANFNRQVKGVADFLDAIPLILEQVPEAYFLLLGRGPEEGSLREKAGRLGIDERLIFAGFREDVDRCYQTMDLSVLTSHSEGLSITVLESMRYGLPVVATRVGGNPEVIQDGITGFLVPSQDPAAFADKVAEVLRHPELKERLSAEARRRVVEQFHLEKVTDRYLDVYEAIYS